MRIESFDPFHIGSKLRYINESQSILIKLFKYYEKDIPKDFELQKGNQINPFLSPTINILSHKSENITMHFNYSSSALNVSGSSLKEPDLVVSLFRDLLKDLEDIGFELESIFAFYEIIARATILLEDDLKPPDVIQKFSPQIFKTIEPIQDLELNIVKFSNESVTKRIEDLVSLEISPNRTSPHSRMTFRMIYRNDKSEEIIKFQENIRSLIEQIFNKLVEK